MEAKVKRKASRSNMSSEGGYGDGIGGGDGGGCMERGRRRKTDGEGRRRKMGERKKENRGNEAGKRF